MSEIGHHIQIATIKYFLLLELEKNNIDPQLFLRILVNVIVNNMFHGKKSHDEIRQGLPDIIGNSTEIVKC